MLAPMRLRARSVAPLDEFDELFERAKPESFGFAVVHFLAGSCGKRRPAALQNIVQNRGEQRKRRDSRQLDQLVAKASGVSPELEVAVEMRESLAEATPKLD